MPRKIDLFQNTWMLYDIRLTFSQNRVYEERIVQFLVFTIAAIVTISYHVACCI